MLVAQYLKAKGEAHQRELRGAIVRAVDSSPSLRSKKDLVLQFVDSLTVTSKVESAWQQFIAAKREQELERIIDEEGLDRTETKRFVANAFRDGAIPSTGTSITKVLPPVSRFGELATHSTKKRTVLERLGAYLERFLGLAAEGQSM